jgi:hypothetical protein
VDVAILEVPNGQKKLGYLRHKTSSRFGSRGDVDFSFLFLWLVAGGKSFRMGELYSIIVVISTEKVEWVERDKMVDTIAIRCQRVSQWAGSIVWCLSAGSAIGLKQGTL